MIARIEPAGDERAGGGSERLADLERRGVVRRGRGQIGRELLARCPRVRADVVAALLHDREQGR